MAHLVLDRELLTYDDVLLVPQKALTSRLDANINSHLTQTIPLTMPLIAANMDSICDVDMVKAMGEQQALGVLHRYATYDQMMEILTSSLPVRLISIGVSAFDLAEKLFNSVAKTPQAQLDAILIDIANGYSDQMKTMVQFIQKKQPGLPIIGGNVATYDGARFLCDLGIDAIKVGIGPGSICSTRLKTGHGYPQLSAIIECSEVLEQYPGVKLIADGGIKQPGDVLKAIAAGADSVMAGSVFSRCNEAAGSVYERDGKKYRQYRGMASWLAQVERFDRDGKLPEGTCAEGEVIEVEVTTTVNKVLEEYRGSLRSGLSYSGATDIDSFKRRAKIVKISGSTNLENSIRGQIIAYGTK